MAPTGNNSRKSANDRLVVLLASGASVRGAAKKCGVSPRTVARRMANSEFRRQVDTAKAAAFGRALNLLASSSVAAVVTLRRLLKDPSAKIRLGAATAILTHSVRVSDSVEVTERLRSIEEQLQQKGGARNGFPVHSTN